MTDEPIVPEKPKVINLFGRDAFEAEKVGVKLTAQEPDELTIKVLEEALKMARTGEITGLIAIAWDPIGKEIWRSVMIPEIEGLETRNSAALMLGGWKMMSTDLEDIAFWTKGYDPLSVINTGVDDDLEIDGDDEDLP